MKIETPADKALYCTVRLKTEYPGSQQVGAGTAFIFGFQEGSGHYPFLVTNKHVVEGAHLGHFWFTHKNSSGMPAVGRSFRITIDDFEALWYGHPDPDIDIAAMPVGPLLSQAKEKGHELFYTHIDQDSILSTEKLEELDTLEEVFFVGYPSGIYDSTNLLPVIRRGLTATPLQIDFEGKPIFLIDASVFPGSSGSPVFLYNLGAYGTRRGFRVGTRVFFLGIVSQVFYREEEGEIVKRPIPTIQKPVAIIKQMIDLGIVYKSSAVLETVQSLISTLKSEGSI